MDWVSDNVDNYLVPVVGMPRRVAEAIEVLRTLWPYDEGPAHIVIGDWNLRDSDLLFCIHAAERGEYSDYPQGHPILAATIALLRWLLENVAEDERQNWERYPAPRPEGHPLPDGMPDDGGVGYGTF